MMRRPFRGWIRRIAAVAIVLVAVYVVLAYMVLPALWTHYEHEPGLAGRPMVTVTADDIPGDPLNVGLVGTAAEAIRALAAAGWYPADAVTLRTSIEIAGSVIFDRPYRHAPVSPLFYEGRKQDFAFEKPVGNSAARRNHVRFWRTLERGAEGRPVFLGSATFDHGVGDQPLYGPDHPPHRPRHRCRARPPDRGPCRRERAGADLSGHRHRTDAPWQEWRGRSVLHRW